MRSTAPASPIDVARNGEDDLDVLATDALGEVRERVVDYGQRERTVPLPCGGLLPRLGAGQYDQHCNPRCDRSNDAHNVSDPELSNSQACRSLQRELLGKRQDAKANCLSGLLDFLIWVQQEGSIATK